MDAMERAPLVSEDPESGDSIEEQVPEVHRSARSKSFMRTVAAILVIGAVAAVVVTGPIDNPLHADMGNVQQNWGYSSFSDAFAAAKAKAVEAVAAAKTHGSAALGWTERQVAEHRDKLTNLLESGFSNQTMAYQAATIARFRAAGKFAQQDAQDRFCSLRTSSYGIKSRLAAKMRKDFANTTGPCGVDFKSQACTDEGVADACTGAGTGFTADLCKITFNDVVKHIQENMSAFLVKAQQDSAVLAGPGGALETNINSQMGEVDAKFAAVCN